MPLRARVFAVLSFVFAAALGWADRAAAGGMTRHKLARTDLMIFCVSQPTVENLAIKIAKDPEGGKSAYAMMEMFKSCARFRVSQADWTVKVVKTGKVGDGVVHVFTIPRGTGVKMAGQPTAPLYGAFVNLTGAGAEGWEDLLSAQLIHGRALGEVAFD